MSKKKIESRQRLDLRINYLPLQSSYTKRIVPAIYILPLFQNLVKEKTRRLQSSSLSKQIQKQKLLLQHLYSIIKSKFCQRKKPDNSHPTLKKGINKRAHSNAHLYSITFTKICQRKKSDDFSSDYHERRYVHRTTIPTHIYSISRNRNLVNENHCLRKCVRGPL